MLWSLKVYTSEKLCPSVHVQWKNEDEAKLYPILLELAHED